MVRISLVLVLTPLYLYVSTFRSMCAVPNMADFSSSLTSWFPAMLLTYLLNDFEMVPVASIIIIIIITIIRKWVYTWWQCATMQYSTIQENTIPYKVSNPITVLERPRGFQEVEAHRFQDIHYMKVVRSSALHTGRLYPEPTPPLPENIPGTHFC
jgi:hypothetical protein